MNRVQQIVSKEIIIGSKSKLEVRLKRLIHWN